MSNTIGEEGFKNAGMEAAWMTPLPWYCELTAGAYAPVANDASGAADHPLDFNSSTTGTFPYLFHLKNLIDMDDDTTMELGASDLTGMGDDGLHHAVYGADFTLRNVPLRRSNQAGCTRVRCSATMRNVSARAGFDVGSKPSTSARWAANRRRRSAMSSR